MECGTNFPEFLEEPVKRNLLLLAGLICMSAAFASAADTSINGWISDSMCAAKHAGTGGQCAKKCIESMGAKPVFVDEAKKEVWQIDNPDAVKGHYGEKVTISATTNADTKTVHVDSITAAK
jgi:hypothetical protein